MGRHDTFCRWFIYALGGGMGHFHRSISLARVATRMGNHVHLLTNSSFAPHISPDNELATLGQVEKIPARLTKAETIRLVRRSLETTEKDVLIIDTFPRGLGGELAEIIPALNLPKILIHRQIPPDYIESHQLNGFISHYNLLLLPGENAPFQHRENAKLTAPWLIRDNYELLKRTTAREHFEIQEKDLSALVVVLGSGKALEAEQMKSISARLAEQFSHKAIIRFSEPCANWPLLKYMPGIDLIVGSGGYNIVQEIRATKTRLLAFPRKRLYDRQFSRLKPDEIVNNEGDLVNAVSHFLDTHIPHEKQTPLYPNGVHQAVEAITELAAEWVSN